MANQEHLDILKQGVEVWNQWRQGNPKIKPDLRDAYLDGYDLESADKESYIFKDPDHDHLFGLIMISFIFRANLIGANLNNTDLTNANLRCANFIDAGLSGACLCRAKLDSVDFTYANFTNADLTYASLVNTDMTYANLNGANLSGADFIGATIGNTIFGDVDLSTAKGLETVKHKSHSTIGIDTIYRSRGNIPEIFLKGAGLDDSFISYIRSLVGKPTQYYSCFISYSSKDEAFARRLYADLQTHNVRCWYAPEDMKTGDVIRTRIDEAIRVHDKLMLVLSQHSVESSWVEKEVETAFEKERQQHRHVLFPVRLDDVVMQTSMSWAADIRRMRHITDFTDWKDYDAYQQAFSRLLRDLKAET